MNVQLALRDAASVASQVTVVDPVGNPDPDAGVQTTFTGGCPSCAAGVLNVAVGFGWLVRAVNAMFAGQLASVGGLLMGVGGVIDGPWPPQLAARAAIARR
jgi:hypothetical protein